MEEVRRTHAAADCDGQRQTAHVNRVETDERQHSGSSGLQGSGQPQTTIGERREEGAGDGQKVRASCLLPFLALLAFCPRPSPARTPLLALLRFSPCKRHPAAIGTPQGAALGSQRAANPPQWIACVDSPPSAPPLPPPQPWRNGPSEHLLHWRRTYRERER